MPRQRQPTNVLALRGTFKANPSRGRARANEPKPAAPLGVAPEHLTPEATAAWDELVAHAHAGTLSSADRPFMEYAAKVWAEIKAAEVVDPKVGIRFEQICAKLGMTPADRSRVSVPKPSGEGNPFAEFAAR